MYLASSYWRSALNIGDMRLFKTEKQAWEYVDGTLKPMFPQFARVYELKDGQPPKLLKRKVSDGD